MSNLNNLIILQNNVRGLNDYDYFCEWKAKINSLPFICDMILLSEVKLKPKVNVGIYEIPQYKLYACLRDAKNSKGGLLMYVREGIKHDITLHSTSFEKCTCSMYINNLTFHVIACYRPPEANNLNEFLLSLESSITQCRENIALIGDINIDKNSSCRDTTRYVNLLSQYGLKVINNHVTREMSGKIIDHFACDFYDSHFIANHTIKQDASATDHSIIITAIEVSLSRPSRYKTITKSSLNFDLLAPNFHLTLDECMNENDPNNIAKLINESTENAINSCKTSSQFRVKRAEKICPWANEELLTLMKKKDRLHHKLQKHRDSVERKASYVTACKNFRDLNNKLRNKFFHSKFSSNSPKIWWENIALLNGSKKKKSSTPEKISHNGEELTNLYSIANAFNKVFTSLPDYHSNSQLNDFVHSRSPTMNSLYLHPTDNEEVSAIIRKLKSSSSAGIDNVSPKIIKRLRYEITPLLVHLINQIFISGIYPENYKTAIVVPLHKSESTEEINNYRPISILTVFNKIVERVLHNRLSSFFRKNNILDNNQFGFRKNSGTENAAIEVINYIQVELDKGKKVSAVFIDLQKAFDSVHHNVLLSTLNDIGVRGLCNNLIKNYLTGRKQIVKINDTRSSPLSINKGVVQGSIIGPLLFLVVINHLASIKLNGRIILYADDAVLLQAHNKKAQIEGTITEDMNSILKFFESRKLTINKSKTVFMVFHSHYNHPNIPNVIFINNTFSLLKVNQFKYLGCWLDSSLSFDKHIQTVTAKITPAVYSIWKLQNVLPLKHRWSMFHALVMSHLQFLVVCWGTTTHKLIEPLQLIQNRAIRNVLKLDQRQNRVEMYTSNNILPIRGLCYQRTAIFVHASLNNYTLSTFNFITKNQKRNRKIIEPYLAHNRYGDRCMMSFGVKIFNKLPKEIRESKKRIEFKNLLNSFLFQSGLLPKFFDRIFLDIVLQ